MSTDHQVKLLLLIILLKVKGEANVGDVFDTAVVLVFDGASGYGTGKAAMKYKADPRSNAQLFRAAGPEKVAKGVAR